MNTLLLIFWPLVGVAAWAWVQFRYEVPFNKALHYEMDAADLFIRGALCAVMALAGPVAILVALIVIPAFRLDGFPYAPPQPLEPSLPPDRHQEPTTFDPSKWTGRPN